jgi:hypothetical protein
MAGAGEVTSSHPWVAANAVVLHIAATAITNVANSLRIFFCFQCKSNYLFGGSQRKMEG